VFNEGAVAGFSKSCAQKVAEAISVALLNYSPSGITSKKDQEVFGVGVRHRYFTFYHGCKLLLLNLLTLQRFYSQVPR
jgi:hypothetical protein